MMDNHFLSPVTFQAYKQLSAEMSAGYSKLKKRFRRARAEADRQRATKNEAPQQHRSRKAA
jgi:hypothetical protein